ncbi:hypothetical protein Pcinc_011274 [Petrolisthes cinctipes]|uniref:Uncharacterized protein n=1 Tax=Petrolisthes cinctipes TaxID=88211 RepID=A0AAE1KUK5_PETCI|nr:hypothetical protein Pcinc_011274 [Petrolisthes cinctipes]
MASMLEKLEFLGKPVRNKIQFPWLEAKKKTAHKKQGLLQPPLVNIIISNIRGLYPKSDPNKVPYLSDLADTGETEVMALTETHLHPGIKDAEIKIPGITIIRRDREGRSHGGVAVYAREETAVDAEVLDTFSNGTTETIVCP